MWPKLTDHLNKNYVVDFYHDMIRNDILCVFDCDTVASREAFLDDYLNKIITASMLGDSFSRPQIFYVYDILPPALIFMMHDYFSRRCCNSENFVFICPSHVGMFDWWEQYKELMGVKSIVFIDAPYIGMYADRFNVTDRIKDRAFWMKSKESLEKHFTAWISGKDFVPIENQYLMLLLLRHKEQGIIDCLSPIKDKEELLAYAENVTNFCNAQLIDQINNTYDSNVFGNYYHSGIEFIGADGPVGAIGDDYLLVQDIKCPINVARETMIDMPYYCFSEKSFRPFLHHQLMLPVGYDGYGHLKKMGFEFPDLIDYSYCSVRNFNQRLTKMLDELDHLLEQPLDFFLDHYVKNADLYEHNFYNAIDPKTDDGNMMLAVSQFDKKFRNC